MPTPTTLVTPGRITHRVTGLANKEHTVRVVQRSEVPWATSTFGGFVPLDGEILPAPDDRDLQLEFDGDSFTAGYGNTSTSRDCTGDQVTRTTNADLTCGAVAARALGADYQVNAFSGRGMVRNYAGGEPGTSYRTYYDRALPGVAGDVWDRPASWQPDAVVVGLGINDFSTALNSNEAWATPAALREAWVTAYHGFIDTLRAQYGPDPYIVVSATYVQTGTDLADLAQRVVTEEQAGGDGRVRYWYYGNEGLDYSGCHWHPSVADDKVIAAQLTSYLKALPLGSGPTPTATPTSTPTPTPTPSPSPTAQPQACTAKLTVGGTWPGGYQASVDVTAGTAISRWRTTITLPTGGALTQLWSGDVATSGQVVTVTNKEWNGALAAGRSTAFGFLGTGNPPANGTLPCSAT